MWNFSDSFRSDLGNVRLTSDARSRPEMWRRKTSKSDDCLEFLKHLTSGMSARIVSAVFSPTPLTLESSSYFRLSSGLFWTIFIIVLLSFSISFPIYRASFFIKFTISLSKFLFSNWLVICFNLSVRDSTLFRNSWRLFYQDSEVSRGLECSPCKIQQWRMSQMNQFFA